MTDQPAAEPAKHGRRLTWFYVVVVVVIALGLFGVWLWRTWNVWWFDAAEAKRRQAEAAAQLGLPVEKSIDLGDGVKLDLVLIPPGRFRMGDQTGQREEKYQWVRITKPFYVGKYEVTQEVWEGVMGTNPGYFRNEKRPVESVSWDDCQGFLKKLNAESKEPGMFRLPSEAEWEWACRAGTRTSFCFGDEENGLEDYAWYGSNPGGTTHLVGGKQPNAWGLYDCLGNVFEWCGDWCGEYTGGWWSKTDPAGPMTSPYRALRGGAWDYTGGCCESAYRTARNPDYRTYDCGFRVALSLPKTH